MRDSAWLRLANDWVHNVASALWAACVIVLFVLDRQQPLMAEGSVDAWHVLAHVSAVMFQLLLVSLLVVIVTGVVRLLYRRRESAADRAPAKRATFIGTHVAYALIYAAGTVWAYSMIWPR